MMELCRELLLEWCQKMLYLQVTRPGLKGITGGILCPACARIHGRSLDAFYPFLWAADIQKDERFLEAAFLLYEWAEACVSMPDGSYRNDTNSQWKGITVFSVIQMAEALKYHGHILPEAWKQRILDRIEKAAEFLYSFEELNNNNVNYLIGNSLALHLSGIILQNKIYIEKAEELAGNALLHISGEGILFGEGSPAAGYSPKGCRPVDIGYNIEESLPALAQYAYEISRKNDGSLPVENMVSQVIDSLKVHQDFILEDGGIDNSFGTRNFKWTYWGSRTSDGCGLGYLLFADREPDFGRTAFRNLSLLKRCTHDGLLYGGLHNYELGEKPCVHHTFTHAKVLAGILDRGLEKYLCSQPRETPQEIRWRHYPDIELYRVEGPEYLADISLYDWEYGDLKHGHASGGTMTLLWQRQYGPVLCAGMNQYTMKEADNMQGPILPFHECISPRIEGEGRIKGYSSLYNFAGSLAVRSNRPLHIQVDGALADENHQSLSTQNGRYSIEYIFGKKEIRFQTALPEHAFVVFPVIADPDTWTYQNGENFIWEKNGVRIILTMETGKAAWPYGSKRIYHLVPGLGAVKTEIRGDAAKGGAACWRLSIERITK